MTAEETILVMEVGVHDKALATKVRAIIDERDELRKQLAKMNISAHISGAATMTYTNYTGDTARGERQPITLREELDRR